VTTPEYVPFDPVDRTPRELVERALLDAAIKTPDWTPRDGNAELVMMESLALIVAEQDYAANRVPQRTADEVFSRLGIARGIGTFPTATITFTVTAPTGATLPAGTLVRLDLPDGDALTFTTDAAVSVAAGATTVNAAATGSERTAKANGTASGTVLTVISGEPVIDSAKLGSAVNAGSDPEDDQSWRSRAVARFSRLTSTLVAPKHFETEARATEGVARARAIDNYDGTATAAGHMTVAVIGSGGALLSTTAKTDLQTALDDQAQANLIVHVVDPTITAVNVDATVKALPGYAAADVQANVQQLLDDYLSPDSWDWGSTVRRNELIAQIDRVDGVDYVATLTAPTGDVALAGAAPLADLGTLTVTVT
jgi:uncharacterized phage protein gp47/JayE